MPSHPRYISMDFLNDYENTRILRGLESSAMQLIYSFGRYVPVKRQRYLVDYYDQLRIPYKQSMLFNLVYQNTEHEDVWQLLVTLLLREPHHILNNIRTLSNLLWCDEALIFKCGEHPALIREMIRGITKELKEREYTDPQRDPRYESNRKRYLACIEVVLSILRLREDPSFDILTAGAREAIDLAELIRSVDDLMGNPESRIKLLVKKPEALRNMSDVAYAIDRYLTGNEGADAIEVLRVEADQ